MTDLSYHTHTHRYKETKKESNKLFALYELSEKGKRRKSRKHDKKKKKTPSSQCVVLVRAGDPSDILSRRRVLTELIH